MKEKKFFNGQSITPKNRGPWILINDVDGKAVQLKFGEIYHVMSYCEYHPLFGWLISISEFGITNVFNESGFDPVVSTNELIKELEEIPCEV